jgi:ABC-type Fe3+ transport system permease subunit
VTRLWLGLGWAGLLVLPWYGLEEPLRAVLALRPEAAPAMFQGHAWLWPLVAPLLIAMGGRPRMLVLGGALGILWLGVEGFSIGLRGWSFSYLVAMFGAPGPTQPALGWGALVYAVACVMLIALGLARRGWCRGDFFVLGALLLVTGFILLFVGYPVISILTSAARDDGGKFAPDLFAQKLFSADIWSLACISGTHACGVAWNTLAQATLVGVLATLLAALGLLTAWLLDRQRFAGRTAFEFLTMMSFAILGTVIGISYILAFNVPPVELTGTGLIIIISFVFRNMPVGIRAGLASLSQIDRSLDEASQTLGARSFRTLRLVLLPILRPAVVSAMVYSFVRAVTTVSAVIFLVSGEYSLATVYIVGRADVGEYGVALVYSAVLIIVMAVVLVGISAVVGEQRIGRRGIAAAQPVMSQA